MSGRTATEGNAGDLTLDALASRRGARRPADVPREVLRYLEAGGQSVNHMEQMALDFRRLLVAVLPEAADRAAEVGVPRFLDRMRAGARIAHDVHGSRLHEVARTWSSDTARGWAAFAVPLADRPLAEQLAMSRAYADDAHFAVREWAWLGLRPSVAAEPLAAVELLVSWSSHNSPFVRRFASEVLRPRGVWSAHIAEFKRTPALALPVLDPLVVDAHKYVRDSVANWLNDAARSNPAWVRRHCAEWVAKHGDDVTYVCRRAMRSISCGEVLPAVVAP